MTYICTRCHDIITEGWCKCHTINIIKEGLATKFGGDLSCIQVEKSEIRLPKQCGSCGSYKHGMCLVTKEHTKPVTACLLNV